MALKADTVLDGGMMQFEHKFISAMIEMRLEILDDNVQNGEKDKYNN